MPCAEMAPSEDSIIGDLWHEKTFPQAHASAWETGCRRGASGLRATCRCSLEAIIHPQAHLPAGPRFHETLSTGQ